MVKKTAKNKKYKKTKVSRNSRATKTFHNKWLFFVGFLVCMVGISLILGYIYGKKEGVSNCPRCENLMIKRIVMNPDKKAKLPVCGLVSKNRSCLFYVLNNGPYDKVVEDFFEEVSVKMGRSIFNIRVENPLYAKMIIPPGRFAEIVVPALQ